MMNDIDDELVLSPPIAPSSGTRSDCLSRLHPTVLRTFRQLTARTSPRQKKPFRSTVDSLDSHGQRANTQSMNQHRCDL